MVQLSYSYMTIRLSGAKSCFLVHLKEWQMAASCISPAPQQSLWGGGWQHLLDHSSGSPHLHLVARNCWWLWLFLFIDMAGDIFISQFLLAFCILGRLSISLLSELKIIFSNLSSVFWIYLGFSVFIFPWLNWSIFFSYGFWVFFFSFES